MDRMSATTWALVWVVLAMVCTAGAAGTSPPDFTQRAEPSFPRGGVAQNHRRVVLKSKDAVPGAEGFARVSQRLGIAAGDVPTGDDVDSALSKLLEKAEYAVKDSLVWAAGGAAVGEAPPNDPDYRFQWGLTRVGGPDAWKLLPQAAPGPKITVCVTDSGVDARHPDVASNLDPKIGFNSIDKSSNVKDGLKHGTHVAGIVAAVDNNGLAVAGVGANLTQVLSCKFLNDEGYGYASDAVACIDYCLENGADIITNSWSGGPDSPALRDAISQAAKQDALFVVAAGNTATDLDAETSYPASYASEFSNVLVVASTDYKDRLSNFSSYGAGTVHVAAPGEWILSTVPGNDTAYYSGTSMAAPLVAGTAALAQVAAGGTLSAKELRDLIIRTAEPLPSLQGKVASGGILRTDKAVEAAAALRVPAPGPKASRKMLVV